MVVGDPTETDLKTYQSSNSSSATKTDTPIREIPHSIQVITRAVMNDQQNISISESLRNVSGVIPNNPLLTTSYEWALITDLSIFSQNHSHNWTGLTKLLRIYRSLWDKIVI